MIPDPDTTSGMNFNENNDVFHQQKRHIGALARSGLLPAAFRPFRSGRFSRSGRARQIV